MFRLLINSQSDDIITICSVRNLEKITQFFLKLFKFASLILITTLLK